MAPARWDDGRTLLRTPLAEPLEARFGFPHYQLHRADLLAALADRIPAGRLHLGHRLTGFADRGDRVEARFANGVTSEVDVLVGADGIHSTVRRDLFGPEHPRFTGCIAYRGLVPAARLRNLALEVTAQIWMGPGQHFVHYLVSAGRYVNFVAVLEQDTWTRESWTDRGRAADALNSSGIHFRTAHPGGGRSRRQHEGGAWRIGVSRLRPLGTTRAASLGHRLR